MLKKLLSDTLIYGLSTIISRLIGYLLIPIHTKAFPPEEYAVVSYFYAYVVLANVLYTYGMETAFFRFASKGKAEKYHSYNHIMSSLLISSVIFSSLLYFGSSYIGQATGFENGELYVKWFAFLFAIDALLAIPFAKLRIEGKAKKFAVIKIIEVTFTVLLNIFFIVFCKDVFENGSYEWVENFVAQIYFPWIGVGYVFLANLIAKIIVFLILLPEISKWKFDFSIKKLKPYYAYGFPLVFSGIAFAINEVADRQLLLWLLPDNFYDFGNAEYAMGVYSACYKLSLFVTLAVQAYKYAIEPLFFKESRKEGAELKFATTMKYFVIVMGIAFILINANIDWLAPIIIRQSSYLVGLSIVPFLLLANIFLGMYYNLSVWFKVTDKTIYGAYISLGGSVITIALNILLIPLIGYHGSAIATLSCYGAMFFISYYIGQKYYYVPYQMNRILFYLFYSCILTGLGYYLKTDDFWQNFILFNGIALFYGISLVVLEKKELKNIIIK